jgi:HSP90 family molecular chaperone
MPERQKTIYYITGESLTTTKNLPFIEVLKKKGFGVPLFDPVEEYATSQLRAFDGNELVSFPKVWNSKGLRRRRPTSRVCRPVRHGQGCPG